MVTKETGAMRCETIYIKSDNPSQAGRVKINAEDFDPKTMKKADDQTDPAENDAQGGWGASDADAPADGETGAQGASEGQGGGN